MSEKRKTVKGFGQRIKEVRNERDLTQIEFGKIIGVEGSYISIMEKHDVYPNDRIIWTLCGKLFVIEHWLKTGEGPKYKLTTNGKVRDISINYKTPPGPLERALTGVKEIYSHGDPYLIQTIEAAVYLARKSIDQDRLLDRLKRETEKDMPEQSPAGGATIKHKVT